MKTNNQATASQAVTVMPDHYFTPRLKGVAAIFILLGLMAFVGTIEYTDDQFYSIPDIAFEEIMLKLGDCATRQDIVKEYQDNKDYYLSLN